MMQRLLIAVLVCIACGVAVLAQPGAEEAYKANMTAARAAMTRADFPGAEQEYRAALAQGMSLTGQPQYVLEAIKGLAGAYRCQGKTKEEGEMRRSALTVLTRLQGAGSPAVIAAQVELVTFLRRQKQEAEALTALKQAAAAIGKSPGVEYLDVLPELAAQLEATNQWSLATPLRRRAVELAKQRQPDVLGVEVPYLVPLGDCLRHAKAFTEAQGVYETVLAHYKEHPGVDPMPSYAAYRGLGALYDDQKQATKAVAAYQQAEQTLLRFFGPNSPTYGLEIVRLSAYHRAAGRITEADALRVKGLAVLRDLFAKDAPEVLTVLEPYIAVLRGQGKTDDADTFEALAGMLKQ